MMRRQERIEKKFREAFDAWYVEHCLDIVAHPLGSRDSVLQWQAWKGAAEALAPGTIQMKVELAKLLLSSVRLAEAAQEMLDAEWMVSHDWGGDRYSVKEKLQNAITDCLESRRVKVK